MASTGANILYVLLISMALRVSSPSLTTSFRAPQTLPSDDFYDSLDPVSTVLPTTPSGGSSFPRCEYDRCLDHQPSCHKVVDATRCSCPGFTHHKQQPDPPDLIAVAWNGSEVVVRWCAPYSHVSGYVVTVGGETRRRVEENRRSAGVGDIQEVSQVCVAALNDAGSSRPACTMYRPRRHSGAVRAGIIGGGLGLLLLILLAAAVWGRRRKQKRNHGVTMTSVQND